MKLLIVDDEQLTRKGIQESLDLKALSVDQVILADDGLHGLEEAKKNSPDLVLTDVRMPRMTGVEMAERILKEDPDVSIVFMSAYSDKEYLKAAIKLKAVSYVEKPLDLEELQASLKEAAENRLARLHSRSIAQSHEKHSGKTGTGADRKGTSAKGYHLAADSGPKASLYILHQLFDSGGSFPDPYLRAVIGCFQESESAL